MPKYSSRAIKSQEFIKTIEATNLEEATFIFSNLKKLTKEKFLEIYEVVER